MKKSFTYFFRGLLCICFLCILTRVGLAQICADPSNVFYGLTNAGNIRPVNINTAVVDSPFATTPFNQPYLPLANAMGLDPVFRVFYYFSVENGAVQFTSFNPGSGASLNLNPIPNYSGVVSACVNATGSSYYCLNGGYQLWYYSIFAGSWTVLTTDFVDQFGNDVTGNFQSMTGGDMAMDGAGNIWMVIASSNRFALYVISADALPTNTVASIPVIQLIPPSSSSFTNGVSFDGIAFDPVGQIYLSTQTDLFRLHTDLSTIDHIGTFNLSSTEAMYDLTSCNFPEEVLPVSWTNFTASSQPDGSVNLQWQYGQAVDQGTYGIERSTDGQNWTGIGTQWVHQAAAAAGYSFPDTHPVTGKDYYRIVLQRPGFPDAYSGIRVVETGSKPPVYVIVPNPVRNTLYIQYNATQAEAQAGIYDAAGKMVSSNKVSPGVTTVSVSNLVPGLYIVRITDQDGQVYTQKFIKQ